MRARRYILLSIGWLGLMICAALILSAQRSFDGVADAFTKVAVSPDGKTEARPTHDGTAIALWDVVAGKERARLSDDIRSIYTLAFSPDGMTLASGGSHMVRLWDAATGEERASLKGDRGLAAFMSVAFSPDGSTLAAGGLGTPLHSWDLASGNGLYRETPWWLHHPPWWVDADPGEDSITHIVFSADGANIAAVIGDRVGIWDAETGKYAGTLVQVLRPITFTDDGKLLVLLGSNKRMNVREMTLLQMMCLGTICLLSSVALSFTVLRRDRSRRNPSPHVRTP